MRSSSTRSSSIAAAAKSAPPIATSLSVASSAVPAPPTPELPRDGLQLGVERIDAGLGGGVALLRLRRAARVVPRAGVRKLLLDRRELGLGLLDLGLEPP